MPSAPALGTRPETNSTRDFTPEARRVAGDIARRVTFFLDPREGYGGKIPTTDRYTDANSHVMQTSRPVYVEGSAARRNGFNYPRNIDFVTALVHPAFRDRNWTAFETAVRAALPDYLPTGFSVVHFQFHGIDTLRYGDRAHHTAVVSVPEGAVQPSDSPAAENHSAT